MRLAMLRPGREPVAIDRSGQARKLAFTGDLNKLICEGVDPTSLDLGEPVDATKLAAPVRPGKVVAIGLNYQDHIDEAGVLAPERPLIFAKFPSSVIGPDEAIVVDDELTARVPAQMVS